MQKVKSANIVAIGHEGTTLTAVFKSGARWSYHDVPQHVHRELVTAESIGSYFFHNIRDKYKGTKHVEG